uniref:Putative transposase n=1 Tax=viral metagenome TaxID=1070528 RepID=A0A6M3LC29_9ZZZZ
MEGAAQRSGAAQAEEGGGHKPPDNQSAGALSLPEVYLEGGGQKWTDNHRGRALSLPEDYQEEEGHISRDTQLIAASSPLNIYVSTYEAAQDVRLETMNRIRCWLRDTHPAEEWDELDFSDKTVNDADFLPNDMRDMVAHVSELEKAASRALRREVRKHPLWPWLAPIRGMGEVLAGRLLHRLGDIYRFPSPAHLWSYCGLDGPGWKQRPHSWKLTSVCYLIAESFQKQPLMSGGYRDIYDARKAYEVTRPWCGTCHPKGNTDPREVCTPGHINNKARRYTVKAFLKDLWREANGYTNETEEIV